MRVEELDTPNVIVDLDLLESNIRSMSAYCATYGIGLRPHTKTHKIPAIARLQMDAGARGITVAKLGEAEVMAKAGLDNILIAYPILGALKTERLLAWPLNGRSQWLWTRQSPRRESRER
jgi:D-serine deaminase-like pyridoxal phosphate-dependent protein